MEGIDYILLYEMCLEVNNFFTPDNKPRTFAADNIEDIPESFLLLNRTIQEFIKDDNNKMSAIQSESWAGTSYAKDLTKTAWQAAFAKNLRLYRRAKFI